MDDKAYVGCRSSSREGLITYRPGFGSLQLRRNLYGPLIIIIIMPQKRFVMSNADYLVCLCGVAGLMVSNPERSRGGDVSGWPVRDCRHGR